MIYDHSYNLLSIEFQKNPYPLFAMLRQNNPVYWSDQLQSWLITPYEMVVKCLSDCRISANRIIPRIYQFPEHLQEKFKPLERTLSMWPLMLDRPNHTRLRMLINKAMTPSIVRGFVPLIQRLVIELLDKVQTQGCVDIIGDLAYPFPLNVVSEIIGVPPEYRHSLKACAVNIVNFFGSPPYLYVERADTAMRSINNVSEFLRNILQERRRYPKLDLISKLIAAEERGDVLSEDEIISTCLMMVFAGFETTTNLIGNGCLILLQHPKELEKLRNDPALIKNAIGEMLRFESPVQRLSRMALSDFDLYGHQIKKGDLIFLMASSANRDANKFKDPDQFNITRDTTKHLAFGHSIHTCPGNTLAQLEAQIFFVELIRRFSNFKMIETEPDWQVNLSVRSLNRLLIELE